MIAAPAAIGLCRQGIVAGKRHGLDYSTNGVSCLQHFGAADAAKTGNLSQNVLLGLIH